MARLLVSRQNDAEEQKQLENVGRWNRWFHKSEVLGAGESVGYGRRS
jgi:hypothetical protein